MVNLIFDGGDPNLRAADSLLEKREAKNSQRGYLGMSGAGDCQRRIYYRFHFVQSPPHKAKTLKLFRDGHRTEDLVINSLREDTDLRIIDRDLKTGEQIECLDFDGHFAGHLDFEVLGLKQAPTTWHVGEVKCTSEKKFAAFEKLVDKHGEKNALFNWNEGYYAQAQLYMLYRKRKRHWLVVASSGGRAWTAVRTDFNKIEAAKYRDNAKRIIYSQTSIPDRVNESADFYQCRWCEFSPVCHDGEKVERHCRSCVYSEASKDAAWTCTKFNKKLDIPAQLAGCESQRYRPPLVAGQVTMIGDDFVEYKTLSGTWKDVGQKNDE